MKPCILLLTCADDKEADAISSTLLNKKLIACAKKSKVSSDFRWEKSVEHAEEILLMMDSIEELYEKVKEEITKLHSYTVFNLVALPISKTTKGVQKWLEEALK